MLSYFLRRLLLALVTLVLITFVIYGLIRHMPGTPLTTDPTVMDPTLQISDDDLERLNRVYGLDLPWYQAYFKWLGSLTRGDFGRSFDQKKPVTIVIGQRIGPTLLLSVTVTHGEASHVLTGSVPALQLSVVGIEIANPVSTLLTMGWSAWVP